MDFGAIPPEITSLLMYTGPGSAPLVAAASAWNGLAAELASAATAYEAAVSTLTGEEWLGQASGSMAQAASHYINWMSTTAGHAQEAASQASAAAAAYENAFAATVPPQLVMMNRVQLAQLLATNVLGQNNNAIAALEAEYSEMWAQDASAMYSYAANSAAATKLTSFVSPTQTTNPSGQALQSAAVAKAASTAAGTTATTTSTTASTTADTGISLLGSGITENATGLVFDPNSLIGSALTGIGGSSTLNPQWFITAFRNFAGPAYNIEGLPYFSTGMANTMLSLSKGLAPPAAAAGAGAAAAKGLGGLGGLLGGGSGGGGVAAGLGQAASVGKLSVPSTWSLPAPALPSHAAPLPISTISAAPESGAGNLLGGMPLAGVGAGAGANSGPRYGFRPTVMARPPFAG
jgi:PPE-repeat protein